MKMCSKCGLENERIGQRYCKSCHAEYMRSNRKRHSDMTPEQKSRANARSYLHTYIRRGKIEKAQSCEKCGGAQRIEAHHHDYEKPLEVEWLCRPCHLATHQSAGFIV